MASPFRDKWLEFIMLTEVSPLWLCAEDHLCSWHFLLKKFWISMITRKHHLIPQASQTVQGVGSALRGGDKGPDKGTVRRWGGSVQCAPRLAPGTVDRRTFPVAFRLENLCWHHMSVRCTGCQVRKKSLLGSGPAFSLSSYWFPPPRLY